MVGQLFLWYGQKAEILTWIGGYILVAGLIFIMLYVRPKAQTTRETPS